MKKIFLASCLSAVLLLSNDKIQDDKNVIYSQIVDTKKAESNVILKEDKEYMIFNNLTVLPNRTTGLFEIKVFDLDNQDFKIKLNKAVEVCKKENENFIDKSPIGYSFINMKQVADYSNEVKELKTGNEFDLSLCRKDNNKDEYYVKLTVNKYSIDKFIIR